MDRMRVAELFAGAGGFGLGLTRAGFRVVRAFDTWNRALRVHHKNVDFHGLGLEPKAGIDLRLIGYRSAAFSDVNDQAVARVRDVRDLVTVVPSILAAEGVDLIVGGPPCQGFSPMNQINREMAREDERAPSSEDQYTPFEIPQPKRDDEKNEGKRRRKEVRELRDLTIVYALIIASVRPKYFIMENVVEAKEFGEFLTAIRILRSAGYGISQQELDASWYGCASARERLIVVGCLGEADGFLDLYLEAAKTRKRTTVADVLGPDFGEELPNGRRVYWFQYSRESTKATRYTDEPSPTLTGKVLTNGRNTYQPKKTDARNWKTLVEPLPEQYSLIQGFPRGWDWSPANGISNVSQMLANAVPPPLAEAVGRCIIAHDRGERPVLRTKIQVPGYFAEWLARRYSGQRLQDIVAAFRTAQKLAGPAAMGPPDKAVELLGRHPEASGMSPQRRSNLAQAVRLHWQSKANHEADDGDDV